MPSDPKWYATKRGQRKHRDPYCQSLLPTTGATPLDDLDRPTNRLRPCTTCGSPDSQAILEEILGP